MHSQKKFVFKNELQFVSKLLFLVSNFPIERAKKLVISYYIICDFFEVYKEFQKNKNTIL
jgi:hypothetical protein